jgi:tetratricopeptide (TPR) repeat protein
MNRPHHRALFTVLTLLCLGLAEFAPAQISARLSSRFLARGEQALLEVGITGTQPSDFPVIPASEGFEIRRNGAGAQTRLQPGRRLEYVFEYIISSYQIGNHVIPSFEVPVVGNSFRTEPVEFAVFDPDDLKWSEAQAGNVRFRYASTFRVMNPTPYEGETTPVEIKIYVPRDLFVEDWGIPDFQRDGLTSWRFQPSGMRGGLNLMGAPYVSAAYPSTLTTNRSGKVSIGPAKVRLVTTQMIMDGFFQRVNEEVYLDVAKLELDSVPLPDGAPDGFENAVGSFRMEVGTSMTEFQEGDPIPVEIAIRGTGNLDTIRPPKPVIADGWKVYEATTEQRGTERSELSGSTVFRQFMRPLELKGELPAYKLVYFDPKLKNYQTLTSPPIPLKMKPAVAASGALAMAPPQALPLPVERMTDILGLVNPSSLLRSGGPAIPATAWHLLGAALAAILVLKALWMRHGHRFHRDPIRAARLKDLRAVENTNGGESAFLMAAGSFIERWLGADPSPEVREILAERDGKCFRADTPVNGTLAKERRNEILRILRRAASVWVAALVLLGSSPHSQAAEYPATQAQAAFDSARYDEAIRIWLNAGPYDKLSADTLYNIGNACYRAGSPGHAALYYRRALTRDATHAEARQNLRFIERKHGAITVQRPEYQYALARVPLGAWKGAVWTGAWMAVLGLLVFPATRPGARMRIAAVAALVLAPMIAACGGLGWRYFPNDAEFAPVEKQAVIIGEKAVLHADASRTSPEVIDAPPGSLCEVIRESGRWCYVGFATKTRGWIPAESIERIQPQKPPTPPRIRKPKVDGKSA